MLAKPPNPDLLTANSLVVGQNKSKHVSAGKAVFKQQLCLSRIGWEGVNIDVPPLVSIKQSDMLHATVCIGVYAYQ